MKVEFPSRSFPVKVCTLLLSAIFIFISPVAAQELSPELEDILSEVRASMQRAERFGVPLFSPTTFSAADERFQEIQEGLEKGESPEIISRDCEETLRIIEAAFERARISQDELRPLIVVREETIDLVKERLTAWQRDPNFFKGRLVSEPDFREEQSYNLPKAESMFGEAILQIEIGNLDGARSLAEEAEFEYRNSAIDVLKNNYVDETRERLAEAAAGGTVESYQKANAELDELERFLGDPDAREVSIGDLHIEIQHGVQYALSLVAIEASPGGDLGRVDEVTLEDLVALREFAMGSAPSRRALEHFFMAEDDYRHAVSRGEGQIRITDQEAALAAEFAYREAILISFREGPLTEARHELEGSRERVSPEEYRERIQNYEKASNMFEQSQGPGISSKDFLKMIKKSKDWMFFSPLPPGSLPDLVVELWSVPESQKKYAYLKWLTPYPPVVDQLTTVSAVVKNIGIGDVDQKFSTELYVDGKLVKSWTFTPYLKAEKMKDPLRRGETMILDYTGKFSVGKHDFHWKVDAKKEITESDESQSSNELKASYVWKASTGLPDLVVEDIFHDGDLLVGNLTTWKIKIKNKGNTDITTPFLTSISSGGVQFGSFWLDTLKIGKSKIFETKQSTSIIAGNYTYKDTVTGTVDVSNVIPETNEANNVKIEHFTISFVDLAVTSLTVLPANPVVHEQLTYSFDIKNNGPAVASNLFKIRVMPGQVSTKGTTEPIFLNFPKNKLPLKVGDSINLKHKVTLAYADNYQASVIADYADSKGIYKKVYVEKNSANNTKTLNFKLKQSYYVKVSKVEYTECNDGIIVHLDRSGGFWKGEVKLQLMNGPKIISLAKPSNKTEVIIASNQNKSEEIIPSKYSLGYNLNLKVYAVAAGKSIPSPAPEKIVQFPTIDQIVINSISPGSGAKGTTVPVIIYGKALSSSYSSNPPSVSAKSKKCTECPDYDGISVKVKNYTYDQISADLNIKATAAPGKKWIHIWTSCNGANAVPFTISDSKPQTPTLKEYTVYLQKKAGPLKGGNIPFSGSVLPIPNGVLQTIKNVNTALGAKWGVRIIKKGYDTDDCDKSKAVVDLLPGKSTSAFKGASLSKGIPIVACIYAVQANTVPNQVALKITYIK